MTTLRRITDLERRLGFVEGECPCFGERRRPVFVVVEFHEDIAKLPRDPCPRCGRPRIDYTGHTIIVLGPVGRDKLPPMRYLPWRRGEPWGNARSEAV
ncbi:MAG TPA: hypothetical protein VD971_08220 [Phycisphaerales bacterium]|nr:hypothetical protein [Phycisphaerales bacterium]